ncbi:MAG: transposase, partial [Alteromonadaceae bacterium]
MPEGDYIDDGIERRQVVDIDILRHVTEYQAQVLINHQTGDRHVASFLEGVTKAVQYGNKLKAPIVYMSQYQLLPYKQVQAFFTDQMGIPISEGSVYNFCLSAYRKLERFESITKQQLVEAPLLHVDETGININGDSRHWLPCATNA